MNPATINNPLIPTSSNTIDIKPSPFLVDLGEVWSIYGEDLCIEIEQAIEDDKYYSNNNNNNNFIKPKQYQFLIHFISKYDTLIKIGVKYDIQLDMLCRINKLSIKDQLISKKYLLIPINVNLKLKQMVYEYPNYFYNLNKLQLNTIIPYESCIPPPLDKTIEHYNIDETSLSSIESNEETFNETKRNSYMRPIINIDNIIATKRKTMINESINYKLNQLTPLYETYQTIDNTLLDLSTNCIISSSSSLYNNNNNSNQLKEKQNYTTNPVELITFSSRKVKLPLPEI
ncbi:hypothetical protein K502DRAFT_342624 [Neoconidiobolus thromboides FSU 785]|nr:hypothetical protein K502DRAFT_342624 [Neoconidiobolus thromboides FSU 785]